MSSAALRPDKGPTRHSLVSRGEYYGFARTELDDISFQPNVCGLRTVEMSEAP